MLMAFVHRSWWYSASQLYAKHHLTFLRPSMGFADEGGHIIVELL